MTRKNQTSKKLDKPYHGLFPREIVDIPEKIRDWRSMDSDKFFEIIEKPSNSQFCDAMYAFLNRTEASPVSYLSQLEIANQYDLS